MTEHKPGNTPQNDDLLVVQGLRTYFPIYGGLFSRKAVGHVKAVDGVSFRARQGETFGLVGESGCGKTTVAHTILQLTPPSAGKVYFAGQNVFELRPAEFRPVRRQMQMVFQDLSGSLNPRMTVGAILEEPLRVHGIASGHKARETAKELLNMVGMQESDISRYPHEFSGGQRQRIGIARALALKPRLVICDEPVSALDVSIQSQIVNLLSELQERLELTYLFISHDLHVVRHVSHRVGVMYLGKLVEMGPVDALFSHPLHPYTQALLSAISIPDPRVRRNRIVLQGEVPSPINIAPGCRFSSRCHRVIGRCSHQEPALRHMGQGRFVACHLEDP